MRDDDIQKRSPEFPMRLDHFLGAAGAASRRKSAELAKSGCVKVNGQLVHEPGFRVDSGDEVTCSGRRFSLPDKMLYVMLNKPVGYYCTLEDPHADRRAVDLVQVPGARLYNVGRLDKDSEGLLIFTNDGDYAAKLTHPRYGIRKTYEVATDKNIGETTIRRLCQGIEDEGDMLKAANVVRKADRIYLFIMQEGKNREIRRLLRSVGIMINRLKRIMVGELKLGTLPTGKWRFLNQNEVQLSLKSVNSSQR